MSCLTFESVQHGLSQHRHNCSPCCILFIQLHMAASRFTDLKNRKKWVTSQTHLHLDWQLCKSASTVYNEYTSIMEISVISKGRAPPPPPQVYWLTCFSLNSQKQLSLSWFEVLLWDAWSQNRTDVNICHERVQRFRLPHLPELWLNSCRFYSVRGAITISFMYLLISSALLMCVHLCTHHGSFVAVL